MSERIQTGISAEAKLYPLYFSDTSLRDGEQMAGAALNPDQKVRVARALVETGVHSIEAGFPICAPEETEAIRRIIREVNPPMTIALARARRDDIDAAYEALSEAAATRRGINLFIATSGIHLEHKLRKTRVQVLEIIRDAIDYARKRFLVVSFSPEDASRTDPEFLCEVYQTAIESGAFNLGFPDTLGIMTPEKVKSTLRLLYNEVPGLKQRMVGVHFHNDLGLATANTLAAVEVGVQIVQCTVNGIGERAGNAALEEVALALLLNQDQYRRSVSIRPEFLTSLSQLVAVETGIPCSPYKAIVGAHIFTTEAGIHQDGLLKHADTYLPFRPELVGGKPMRLVLGKHSGRAAIIARLKQLGYVLSPADLLRVSEGLKSATKGDWADEKALLERTVEVALKQNNGPKAYVAV